MNQREFIDDVATRLGKTSRESAAAVHAVLDSIQEAVARGEKVTVAGFGVFEKVVKPPRTARNPATGQSVAVPERAQPRFRAGSKFVDVVKAAHNGS